MIQIEHIHIEEFRGLRSLDLDLNSKPFAIFGPNGSGKSGIVDAIDFALTGTLSRLSGSGNGAVSVAAHGPHVHARTTPDSAVVELTVKDVVSGKVAVLRRTVASPSAFSLVPDEPEVRASLLNAGSHPAITLSRRELIKYVVSTPRDRATQVQTLLQLNKLDDFRGRLLTAKNNAATAARTADGTKSRSETDLATHLGIATVDSVEDVLREINKRRSIVGAGELTSLDGQDVIKNGIGAAQGSTVDLVTAIGDTTTLETAGSNFDALDDARATLTTAIAELVADETASLAINRKDLLQRGLPLIVSNACPLCGTEWESMDSLQAHIRAEIEQSEAAKGLSDAIEKSIGSYRPLLQELKHAVEKVIPAAEKYGDPTLPDLLRTWSSDISEQIGLLVSVPTVVASADEFSDRKYDISGTVTTLVSALKDTLEAMPDETATEAAKSYLIVANERWRKVTLDRKAALTAEALADRALKVHDAYKEAYEEQLTTLYQTVEQDFSRYYRAINSSDEAAFSATFTQSGSGLGLEVDFYGLGHFPPNAYHSEGHQDGMGVCLYLALMKQLLGDEFRLAILDDVVMSVDRDHRKQFCELLKTEFPNVQFVITTHDQVWARQMQASGLIGRNQQVRFFGWTVNDGPLFEQGDVWERIDEELAKGDVNAAAHKLRRHLEASMADIAEAIGGQVPYRGDGNYELGDLMNGVVGAHGALLAKAAAAANSWNIQAAKDLVEAKKVQRAAAIDEQKSESWVVNVLVHQNDWAGMTDADFRPALEASKQLLDLFVCENPACTGWIKVVGRPPEVLKCDCDSYSLNLKKKPSA